MDRVSEIYTRKFFWLSILPNWLKAGGGEDVEIPEKIFSNYWSSSSPYFRVLFAVLASYPVEEFFFSLKEVQKPNSLSKILSALFNRIFPGDSQRSNLEVKPKVDQVIMARRQPKRNKKDEETPGGDANGTPKGRKFKAIELDSEEDEDEYEVKNY